MANVVTNIGKGRFAYYATLPATNDALIAVVLEATGLESDDALQDYDNLSLLLAGASNEQTTMGRKTLTSVTSTQNDVANTASIDCADVTWTAATGNATGKLVVCYNPDTTAGANDTAVIPLTMHDFAVSPDGTDITVQIDAAGLATSSDA
jgi:hypothetical protein